MTVVDLTDVRERVSISADLELAASALANARRKIVALGFNVDPKSCLILSRGPDALETLAALIEAPAHADVLRLAEGV